MNVTFKPQRLRYVFAPCVLLIVMLSAPSAFAQVVLGEDITQQGRILTVGGSASSTQNATDLTNALAEAAALTPSANNPVLIQLGPGLFDFGTTGIIMPDHVHLRGSGAGVSVLRCACLSAVILADGTTNQFSHLTVENTDTAGTTENADGKAILGIGGANIAIHHTMTVARLGVGFDGATTTAEVTNSTLLSTVGTVGDDALALFNGAKVTVEHSRIDGDDTSSDGVVYGEGTTNILTIRYTFIGTAGVNNPWAGTLTCSFITRPGGSVDDSCNTGSITLSRVLERGKLKCAVRNLPEESFGIVTGYMGIEYCKALANAIFEDTSSSRYELKKIGSGGVNDTLSGLRDGLVDVSFRAHFGTYGRDTGEFRVDFSPPYFYSFHTFMFNMDVTPPNLDLNSLAAILDYINGIVGGPAKVCVAAFSGFQTILDSIGVAPAQQVLSPFGADMDNFLANDGTCSILLRNTVDLASASASAGFPTTISALSFGDGHTVAATRDDDSHWSDVVNYTVMAPMAAEGCGIIKVIGTVQGPPSVPNSSCENLLAGTLGPNLSLPPGAFKRVLEVTGNWGQLFDTGAALASFPHSQSRIAKSKPTLPRGWRIVLSTFQLIKTAIKLTVARDKLKYNPHDLETSGTPTRAICMPTDAAPNSGTP